MKILKLSKSSCAIWHKVQDEFANWLHGRFFKVFLLMVLASCKNDTDSIAGPKDEPPKADEDEYFTIAVIPDTQYYTSLKHGGTMAMFEQQIQWIRDNKEKEKIAYVIHLGDVVDHGDDNNDVEWIRAKNVMYKLEADSIPYGVAVGNHDQTPYGNPGSPGTNNGYGVYFGKNRMERFPWYGGAYGNSNNNDNHYDLFTVNGQDFIVLYIEFNVEGYNTSTDPAEWYSPIIETNIMNWAEGILSTYATRKAIIVSHHILGKPAGSNSNIRPGQGDNRVESNFGKQGQVIYNMAKHHNNVFLMLGGHISGEGFRRDNYNGNIIKSYLSDYQSRENYPYDGSSRNGGNGIMRQMKFNKTKQTLSVHTFAPRVGGEIVSETDGDSDFTEPLYK